MGLLLKGSLLINSVLLPWSPSPPCLLHICSEVLVLLREIFFWTPNTPQSEPSVPSPLFVSELRPLEPVSRGSTVSVISAFPLPAGVRHPAAVFYSLSYVQLFASPWTPACQAPQSSTISQSLLKFMSTESGMLSSHLNPLSSPSPPAFNLSQHQGLFQ